MKITGMSHERYDIWEETDDIYYLVPWRAQMVNYIAQFETKKQAEGFVASVKDYRKKNGLK
jgi:hypothetical protein